MRPPVSELTLEQFLSVYPRIAGAEDPLAPTVEPPAAPPAPAADPPAPPAAPTPPAAEEMVTVTKQEVDALRRKVAEAEKHRRQAERDAREQEEERQRQQGEWKKLAEAKELEAADLRRQVATAGRNTRVSRIAASLNFHDPDDVLHRLTSEEADDDTLATQALERIAAASPHLVKAKEKPKPVIGQVLEPSAAPGGGTAPKTKEHYEKMTAEQLAGLPDDEYKTAIRLLK